MIVGRSRCFATDTNREIKDVILECARIGAEQIQIARPYACMDNAWSEMRLTGALTVREGERHLLYCAEHEHMCGTRAEQTVAMTA